MSMDELANVKGRGWEDIDVSDLTFYSYAHEQCMLTPTLALSNHTIITTEATHRTYKPSTITRSK